MRRRSAILGRLLPRLALAGLALTAVGAGPSPAPPPAGSDGAESTFTADEQLLAIGREVPGFGGMFVGGDGALHVYLRHPEQGSAGLEKALGAAPRIHRGDFTFEQLVDWKHALGPAMALPGVAALDADEARNRVVVGVTHAITSDARAGLMAAIEEAGVPGAAVIVEQVAPFVAIPPAVEKAQSSATLRDTFRPIPGGVQIGWLCGATDCRWCTDTFTAFRGRTFGFVTCSHCSHSRSAVDGTRYVQSSPTSGGEVGSEVVDPPFVACNGGRRCRGSDAIFVRFDKKAFGSFARIARPSSRDPLAGSLLVKPAGARLDVVGAGAPPLVGDTLHKIGRTTGWTYGPVLASCMDVNLDDSDITMTCQTAVAAGVGVGDSGSPVFTRQGGNGALLQGIVWGAGEVDDRDVLIFSPFAAIDRELGPLRIH